MNNTNSRLPVKTKIAYGCGDFASQLCWTMVSSYLMVFYTDVVGLSAAAISMIFLIARIWDGINDPMMGAIAERTKSRFGRFRPYLLFGTPFLAVFYVLTFTAPEFGGNMNAKIAWAMFTYIGVGMLYTLVNLPYGSLSTVMTKDSDERASLTNFRQVGSNTAGILLNAITLPLIMFFSGGTIASAKGYTYTTLLFAVAAIPLFYFTAIQCKEVITPINTAKKVRLRDSLKSAFNKEMIMVMLINFFALLGLFGRMGMVLYYYLYVMQRPDLASVFMTMPMIVGVISIIAFSKYVKMFGKKKMMCIYFSIAVLALILIYFTDYTNIVMLALATILFGVSSAGLPIAMAIIPDAIDYGEDKTGIRADGLAYSVFSLGTKFAGAIGGAVGVLLLAKAGYVANQIQTESTMASMNFVINVLPACCYILAIVCVFFYGIDEEKYKEIRTSLDRKEEAAKENEQDRG